MDELGQMVTRIPHKENKRSRMFARTVSTSKHRDKCPLEQVHRRNARGQVLVRVHVESARNHFSANGTGLDSHCPNAIPAENGILSAINLPTKKENGFGAPSRSYKWAQEFMAFPIPRSGQ
jgi:hypothetical protein